MNIRKMLCLLFVLAACCFLAGALNHIFHTGEGVVSSFLLAAGCLCAAVVFYHTDSR